MVFITFPQPGTADGEVNKHWFLRGVQSAIFYYISCSPYLEYKHKKKRRKEEVELEKQRSQIVDQQPGIIRQPRAFETNEAWAEDLIMGPGPPKGWKPDNLVQKIRKRVDLARPSTLRTTSKKEDADVQPFPNIESPEPAYIRPNPRTPNQSTLPDEQSDSTPTSDRTLVAGASVSDQPFSSRSSAEQPGTPAPRPSGRPSIDRRVYERKISSAMENFKGSLRQSINPETWNWRRYERDDENLTGVAERMTRMWNRATTLAQQESALEEAQLSAGRKRATTIDSDRYSWHRVRHPAINELHPPVVSPLPVNRAEAAWMLLPPPSAAVMAGKLPPAAENRPRWPLSVVGSSPSSLDPPAARSLKETEEEFPGDHRPSEGFTEDFSDVDDRESYGEVDLEDKDTSRRLRHQSDPVDLKLLEPRSPLTHVHSPERRSSWSFQYYIPTPTAV